MYTLLSGLYKYLTEKDEYFVLILGLDNAGKTTFLESAKTRLSPHYKGANLSKITTTVGMNLGKIDVNGVRLNFWDLGGQEELQSLWDKYYEECHAVIYVVDSGDRERVEESKAAFDKMIKNETIKGIPLLVAANKQDLADCMGVREVKHLFENNAEVRHYRGCPLILKNALFQELNSRELMTLATSGLTGEGVEEGIEWVADTALRNSGLRPPHEATR